MTTLQKIVQKYEIDNMRFEHDFNPLNLYSRAVQYGISSNDALKFSQIYEHLIFKRIKETKKFYSL